MRRRLPLLALLSRLACAGEEPGIAVAPEVLEQFRAIEAQAAHADYSAAARHAKELLPRLADDPAARALLLRNLGRLYGLQKHYAQAAETLAQSLELHALPAAEASQALLEMGQYQVAAENYPKAAATLSAWLSQADGPRPEHFLLLAEVRGRLKQYPEAAALVEQAIARSSAPKPEWFQQLLGLYHEGRDFPACARVLAGLIQREPDRLLYWQQLTGIYQEAGQEQQALAVRQLMHARGLLRASADIVQLAQVLRYRGMPNQAAELLQQAIDAGRVEANVAHLELLAETWTEARELRKAAGALESALVLEASGDTYHRLGQTYSELHDWTKARQALAQALAHGGLKNPGGAYLLSGLALYKLNAKDQARDAFLKARTTPAVGKTAQQWLDLMAREDRQQAKSGP